MALSEYRRLAFDKYAETVFQTANCVDSETLNAWAASYEFNYGGFLPSDKRARMLDLGCGFGQFLWYLESSGWTLARGLEVSESQAQKCRTTVDLEVAVSADAAGWLAAQPSFDAIVANDVLEHIPKGEALALLSQVRESLAPGGVFIAKVPNMASPAGNSLRYVDLTHEVGYTAESLAQVMKLAGLGQVEVHGFEIPRVSGPGQFRRRIARRFRRGLQGVAHTALRGYYYCERAAAPSLFHPTIFAVGRRAGL